ncbi:MAG: radical SAM protein [Firmicutes bacterium]|jgi:radical SAM protein with 4Fe4S-binding SPASM domain|nr:radical SAM protein [Bacillota bacterium]
MKLGFARPRRDVGMFHVTLDPERLSVIRLHLRRPEKKLWNIFSKPGYSLLWINGTQLLMLEESTADIVQALIETVENIMKPGEEVSYETWLEIRKKTADKIHSLYPKISLPQIEEDIDYIYRLITDLSKGACPREKGMEGEVITWRDWQAPARIDLMISSMKGSGCQNACSWCYASDMPDVPELDTESWKKVLNLLWEIGVPHIDFTGGEPTTRPDLPELVEYAQKFVTGLITNGRALSGLARRLSDVSLDYVQISIESDNPEVHDRIVRSTGAWKETINGINASLKAGLYTSTNTTLTRENAKDFPRLIRFLGNLGVRYIGCNSLIKTGRGVDHKQALDETELKAILEQSLMAANELNLEFNWFTPTCYLNFNPLELGLGPKSCSACITNMAIRPDGVVTPCQSWLHDGGLGNILTNPWEQIFNHPTARKIRDHEFIDPRFRQCKYLAVCGGACQIDQVLPLQSTSTTKRTGNTVKTRKTGIRL